MIEQGYFSEAMKFLNYWVLVFTVLVRNLYKDLLAEVLPYAATTLISFVAVTSREFCGQ
jgi:hypothetical protein